MTVRLAGPDDIDVVARLLTEFREHEGRDWPPEESIRAGVERLMPRDDTEYLLGGDWWDAEDCNVEDVFVRADARGAGLGRELVSAAIDRARERGCRRMELDTGADNAPAQGLYRSLGFFDSGIFMRRRIDENLP